MLLDTTGTTVVKYTYNAGGVPTIVSDTSGCYIATINPFLYRNYYYDREIQTYYLQSRYYDPQIGRFINVDTSDALKQPNRIFESNLFAYCQNNPVNESDFTGSIFTSIIKKILTGAFKGFIELLGTDFITYLYNVLLVDSNSKFVMSSGSEYLKSVLSAIASELLSFFGSAQFIAQVFTIEGSYFTKIVKGRMNTTDWITLVLKLALLILKSVLKKRLDKKKKNQLDKLKKARKKKSKNANLKIQKKQLKIKFDKLGFKVELSFEITEYVLTNFLDILASI